MRWCAGADFCITRSKLRLSRSARWLLHLSSTSTRCSALFIVPARDRLSECKSKGRSWAQWRNSASLVIIVCCHVKLTMSSTSCVYCCRMAILEFVAKEDGATLSHLTVQCCCKHFDEPQESQQSHCKLLNLQKCVYRPVDVTDPLHNHTGYATL